MLRALTALATLTLLLLIVGCAGPLSSSDSTRTSEVPASGSRDSGVPPDSSAPAGVPESGDTASSKAADSSKAAGGQAGTTVALGERQVISTGSIRLHTTDVDDARTRLQGLVAGWGGVLGSERTTADDAGRASTSMLVVRVPSGSFDAAMRGLAELGEVDEIHRTAEDVTTQVVDNEARVRAAEKSLRQLENLMTRAEKLPDILTLENELARRQADLDSLKSQQAFLAEQTSLATITVQLSTTPPKDKPHDEPREGFLAGLHDGWSALSALTTAALTATGAVLPFAAVLAAIALPAWLLLRRRRTTPAASATGSGAGA